MPWACVGPAGPSSVTHAAMQVPEQLGRYEVVRLLGEGGAGSVYEAVLHGPAGFRKPVALKVLHDARLDLAREACLGGLLRHPNLVEVYELGRVDELWYCAMELVTGGTLASYGTLPPSAVVDVGLQVCAGLAHAHASIGLVHQDLKPQNLLVQDGTVLVGDLGIARTRDGRGPAAVCGTPGYMSPEQAAGEPVDARSDLYSLGIVLCELALGRRPEPSVAASTVVEVPWTESTLEGAAEVRMGPVPEWLEPVMALCLAPDRADRFPGAEALAAALRGLEIDGPTLYDVMRERGLTPGPVARRAPITPPSTNLGPERDRFVGRQAELDDLAERLSRPGLVTVTGMGGVGKTRLARRAAARYAAGTGEQAWFCDLAEARTRADVTHVVAAALDLRLQHEGDEAQLSRALEARGAPLLLLDRLEHLGPHLGWLSDLLTRAPHVRILATSRVALQLPGEHLLRLLPLEPDDAAELLAVRASDRGVAHEVSPDLRELAIRLDGLPLALELAAARLTTLAPARMLELVGERLTLLRGAGGDGNTLAATLDSSWSLLSAEHRRALAELTVFAGGFSLEAAERVLTPGDGPLWIVDTMQQLFDASWLVRRAGQAPEPRFGLLDTVRDYVSRQAEARSPEVRRRAERAHLEGFATWYRWASGQQCLDDLDNLLTAFERALHEATPDLAAACLHGAWFGLEMASGPARALEFCGALLAQEPTGPARGHALALRGHMLASLGASRDAEPVLREALPLVRGRPLLEARVLRSLALVLVFRGETDAARPLLEECLAVAPSSPSITAGTFHSLCLHHRAAGDLEGALVWARRAIQGERLAHDHVGLGLAWSSAGICLAELGRLDEAEDAFRAAVAQFDEAGAPRFGMTDRGNLAELHGLRGRHERAVAEVEVVVAARRQEGEATSLALWLCNLADNQLMLERVGPAREALEEALAQVPHVQKPAVRGLVHAGLGELHLREGDLAAAHRWFSEAEEGYRACGDRYQLVRALSGQARIRSGQGDASGAQRCLAEAEQLARALNVGPESPPARWLEAARAALDG